MAIETRASENPCRSPKLNAPLIANEGCPPPDAVNVNIAAIPPDVISIAPDAFNDNKFSPRILAVNVTLVLTNNPVVPMER